MKRWFDQNDSLLDNDIDRGEVRVTKVLKKKRIEIRLRKEKEKYTI